MDNQKFEIILDRLLELSEEGKLNWKKTASSKTYLLVLNDSSIITDKYSSIIGFQFKNEKGETIEEINLHPSSESKTYDKAEKLYDLARRKALKSDETIDRILEQLNPDSIAA